MRTALRTLLAAAVLLCPPPLCSPPRPTRRPIISPIPRLKTESVGQLQARIRAGLQCHAGQDPECQRDVTDAQMRLLCGTDLARHERREVQAYRDTGVFNERRAAKALASLDSCKLQRPADVRAVSAGGSQRSAGAPAFARTRPGRRRAGRCRSQTIAERLRIEQVLLRQHAGGEVPAVSPGTTGTAACAMIGPGIEFRHDEMHRAAVDAARLPRAPAGGCRCRGTAAAATGGC